MNLKKFVESLAHHEKMILLDILKEDLKETKKNGKLNYIKSWDI